MNLNTEVLSVLSNVKKFLSIPQDLSNNTSRNFTPRWKKQEDFLIVTAIGTHTGTVLILDDESKAELGIAPAKTVLLPFETRRLQKIQAEEFCLRVLNQEEDIDSLQLMYLIELFDVEQNQICSALDLTQEELCEILEHDLELSVTECSEIAEFFLCNRQVYKLVS